MEIYKNKAGDSPIISFESREDAIVIQFDSGFQYLYNSYKPGRKHVQQMIMLAKAGKGLGTYINKYVRNNYAKKIR